MAALKQSKRATWPSDGNLCKVRLVLSKGEPYQSVRGTQDHLQASPAWLLQAGDSGDPNESNNPSPPGRESSYINYPKIQISQIPIIKWQLPPTLVLNQEWHVVAGEESRELNIEDARQEGVLEAIYPRPTLIPPNPLVCPDVQISSAVDDSSTPFIRITAAEDDEEDVTKLSEPVTLPTTNYSKLQLKFTSTYNYNPTSPAPLSVVALDAEPDVAAAAKLALTAIIKSSEEGSLIDHDLLIKLLSEPSMLNKLLSDHNVLKTTEAPSSDHNVLKTAEAPSSTAQTSEALNHDTALPTALPIRSSLKAVPRAKDAGYYKSLVQLYGGDETETASAVENVKSRDSRVRKPCMYFNTSRGCRKGEGCCFFHDAWLAKKYSGHRGRRLKLDGRI